MQFIRIPKLFFSSCANYAEDQKREYRTRARIAAAIYKLISIPAAAAAITTNVAHPK